MSKRKTARRKSTRKTNRSARKTPAKPPTPAQVAARITWQLKGDLKNVQRAYLRVGAKLAEVRDKKMYLELKHPDMEDYADKQLHLGRSSLYKYLSIYDWVSASHPRWLNPKKGEFVPELSDCTDLRWIEDQLKLKNLSPEKRAALEKLQAKALVGSLRQGELNKWRGKSEQGKDTVKDFLARLTKLRTRGAALSKMPPEVITYLDSAIQILRNHNTLAKYTIDLWGTEKDAKIA